MRLTRSFSIIARFSYFLTLSMLSGSPWLIFSALASCFLKLLSQYLLLSLTTFPLSAIVVKINSDWSTIFCLHEFARYKGEFVISKFFSVKSLPRELLKAFEKCSLLSILSFKIDQKFNRYECQLVSIWDFQKLLTFKVFYARHKP